MLKRIKEYFKLRKLKKEAAALLLVNGAEVITGLKDSLSALQEFITTLEDTVKQENIETPKK